MMKTHKLAFVNQDSFRMAPILAKHAILPAKDAQGKNKINVLNVIRVLLQIEVLIQVLKGVVVW
jgi:hypothetical protein